jgi:hypothetical protein
MLPFVDLTARATFTNVTPKRLYEEVADLGNYPDWLGIVHRVEPVADTDETWLVDIGARVGFVTRTKRLRMVRTQAVAPEMVRFERAELDGKEHSPWILTARVEPVDGGGSRLQMDLHYGGGGWIPLLEPVLRQEVVRATERLRGWLEDE